MHLNAFSRFESDSPESISRLFVIYIFILIYEYPFLMHIQLAYPFHICETKIHLIYIPFKKSSTDQNNNIKLKFLKHYKLFIKRHLT